MVSPGKSLLFLQPQSPYCLIVTDLLPVCSLMQVQRKLLYQRVQLSFARIQLGITAGRSTLQRPCAEARSSKSRLVLDPCLCKVSLDLHRIAGHAQLPDIKALVDVNAITVHLTPDAVAALSLALADQQMPDAKASSPRQHTGQSPTEVSVHSASQHYNLSVSSDKARLACSK